MGSTDTNRCPGCGSTLQLGEDSSLCPGCLVDAAAETEMVRVDPTSRQPHPLIRELDGYFDEYEIIECIGRGGMGAVYRARQNSVNRQVAIKILPHEFHDKPELVERFRREAETMGKINDPRLVAIYDYGEVHGLFYIAMELVEGDTFSTRMKSGKMEMREGIALLAEICRAVQVMHDSGIIHRDIKPSNIMVREDCGRPLLMDLGIAKDTATEEPTLTLTGSPMGTPCYMAPEQAAGKRGAIGPTTDVWSLGSMLYEIVSGAPPFVGPSTEVINRVLNEDVSAPERDGHPVSRDLQTICIKALSRDQRHRYASAENLADDLEGFLEGREIKARPVGRATKVWRKLKRRQGMAATVLAGALALAVAGFALVKSSEPRRLAGYRAEFETLVESGEWTPGNFSAMGGLVGEIEALSAADANVLRKRLSDRYGRFVMESLARPRLDPGEIEHVVTHIERLRGIDPEAAEIADGRLDARRAKWEEIASSVAPHAGLGELFSTGAIVAGGGSLRVRKTGKDEVARIRTTVATASYLEVELKFDPDWVNSPRLGAAMSEAENLGYSFEMVALIPADIPEEHPPITLANAAEFALEIRRDGVVLARSVFQNRELETRNLVFTARRARTELSVRIWDSEPVVFDDLFPSKLDGRGRVDLILPRDVGLSEFRISGRKVPESRSPLEQGDELYTASQFGAALDSYLEQTIGDLTAEQAQELEVKQALCLFELGKVEDAKKLFERVLTLPGTRWPAIAGCQLWRQYLREGDTDSATAVFEILSAKFAGKNLAEIIPFEVRQGIIKGFPLQKGGALFSASADRVERLERWEQILDLISTDPRPKYLARWELLRALHSIGETERALKVGQETVKRWGLSTHFSEVHEIPWLLCQLGRSEDALRFADRWRKDLGQGGGGVSRRKRIDILIDRARILAGEERWDEALSDLESWKLENGAGGVSPPNFFNHSRAFLLGGFIQEQRGEEELAKQYWTEGLAYGRSGGMPGGGGDSLGNGFELLHWTMLASLSGSMEKGDVSKEMDARLQHVPAGSPIVFFKTLCQRHPDLILQMWQNDRARDYARDLIFGKISFRETLRVAAAAPGVAIVKVALFRGNATPGQEELAWDMAFQSVDAWFSGRITQVHLGMFLASWKGFTAFWPQQKLTLPEELRAGFGYLLGARLLAIGKKADAKPVLEGAVEDAKEDRVRKLATELLESM